MNKQSVLIFKLPELFKILNELKDNLDFNIYNFTEKQEFLNLNKNKYENYLVLTDIKNQIEEEKFQLILKKLPDSIHSIIEKINVSLLKQKYSEQSDIIIGLETGADDYISKPFEPRELILRMESIFKRIEKFEETKSIENISIGALKYDIKRQELWKGDNLISLTRAERILMNKLINSVNTPVTRQKLTQEIFFDFNKKEKGECNNENENKYLERERVVDVNINRLRKKIEKNPKFPRYLKTVRSIGYMLVPD